MSNYTSSRTLIPGAPMASDYFAPVRALEASLRADPRWRRLETLGQQEDVKVALTVIPEFGVIAPMRVRSAALYAVLTGATLRPFFGFGFGVCVGCARYRWWPDEIGWSELGWSASRIVLPFHDADLLGVELDAMEDIGLRAWLEASDVPALVDPQPQEVVTDDDKTDAIGPGSGAIAPDSDERIGSFRGGNRLRTYFIPSYGN